MSVTGVCVTPRWAVMTSLSRAGTAGGHLSLRGVGTSMLLERVCVLPVTSVPGSFPRPSL